jgi:hypothetical protein
MEQRIASRGYGTSKTGLLGIRWFLIREIVGLLKQVLGERHRLRPSFLAKNSLFRHAPEIVIREETHGREVQTVLKPLDNFACYFVKSWYLARVIRQLNPEEYGPIPTPILTDIVPDVHHIRRQ